MPDIYNNDQRSDALELATNACEPDVLPLAQPAALFIGPRKRAAQQRAG